MTFEVYKSPNPSMGESWIKIRGFEIMTKKSAISNALELEEIEKEIGLPCLPEMLYGNNSLCLKHNNQTVIEFNAIDALRFVDQTSEGSSRIKVSAASKWQKQRDEVDINKEALKPYDWTFTTMYRGSIPSHLNDQDPFHLQSSAAAYDRVDIAKLSIPEPILFYDEILLYEDELGDNGSGIISVKVRVMPSCFLILQRYFLRVDGVLIRMVDTRLYHEFGKMVIVKEFQVREMPYDGVVAKLPFTANGPDYSFLLDFNWISTLLTESSVKDTRLERMVL